MSYHNERGELDCFTPNRAPQWRAWEPELPPVALHDPQPPSEFIGRVARAAGYLPPADVLRLADAVDGVIAGRLPYTRLRDEARCLRAAAAALRGKRPAYEPADPEGSLL